MSRFFNTAGPCRADDHYMLPPERRIVGLRSLIDRKLYFIVHAPRQTGKTTAAESLQAALTRDGGYAAVLASVKTAATAGADVDRGMRAVVWAIAEEARQQLPDELRPPAIDTLPPAGGEALLGVYLTRWCESCPRPVVLFLDEIDSLRDATLLSVLGQLHAGYRTRPEHFPHAMALIGVRDVRDYLITQPDGRSVVGTSSPFNIKSDSLRLSDFTADEVAELYAQHTADTGQEFAAEATAKAYELTAGQPWLVNALARQLVEVEVPERTTVVQPEHVQAAREALILRRDTHLDSLVKLLREKRVRRVIEPVLAGDPLADDVVDDDVEFVRDLGLVRSGYGGLEIANPIYREIVPRALTSVLEESLVLPRPSYLGTDGRLDFAQLLADFREFWIEHAESFLYRAPYSEAAAQLVFLGFLHKVTNGKGDLVDREYAAGRGYMDICVRWPRPDGGFDRFAVELKVWRDTSRVDVEARGRTQLARYLERLGLDYGTLIVFDARSDAKPLPDRCAQAEVMEGGRRITVLRL